MKNKPKILIADDDETFCYVLKEQLIETGFDVTIALNGIRVPELIQKTNYDLVFLDLQMPGISGMVLLSNINENYPTIPVIILTGENEAKRAVECMKNGAFDYVVKPYAFDELLITINRAVELKELKIKSSVLDILSAESTSTKIIGESEPIRNLTTLAGKAARSDSNILIEGETGTGKELFAEFIHKNSPRASKPFVVINCASLPDQLIESELFGYEKGAFTDARTAKQGLVEIADGGTLFLDEIGELSINLQPKLLRFLENGEFRRIGGLSNIHSDVRVISATNRNLSDETANKTFRRDLLYRLNIITLEVPPLRVRGGDILLLAEHFIQKKTPIRARKTLTDDSKNTLLNYSFPGNVRELQHIVERAVIFSDDQFIRTENLFISGNSKNSGLKEKETQIIELPEYDDVLSIDELEKHHIEKVLNKNNWEQAKSAASLGISIKTLYNKIKKYDLRRND